MFKKHLYAVRAENCIVIFPDQYSITTTPVTIFKGNYSEPAVFIKRAAAEKFCSEMNNNYPDTPYTVHKFLPQP